MPLVVKSPALIALTEIDRDGTVREKLPVQASGVKVKSCCSLKVELPVTVLVTEAVTVLPKSAHVFCTTKAVAVEGGAAPIASLTVRAE